MMALNLLTFLLLAINDQPGSENRLFAKRTQCYASRFLLPGQEIKEPKYVVRIDLVFLDHGVDEDGTKYHYKNWSKGSGFVYEDKDGIWILSVGHIISHGISHLVEGSIFAYFHPDLKHDPEEIKFVGYDQKIDVSLFKFTNQESVKKIPCAILGSSKDLKNGQRVMVVGHPLPIQFAITIGYINSVNFSGFLINEYQPQLLAHSCMINSGSSGSPLINLSNEVIGINRMTFERPNVFNLAIPIDDVKFLLPKLKRGGLIEHQTPGLVGFANSFMLSDLDLGDMDIDKRPASGIMIIGFKEKSLVELAGFEKGDVIVSCNGQKPKGLIDFLKMIYLKAEAYEILKIEIDRYGKKIILPLLLFDPEEKEVEIE